ncbi:uncharacterized protein K460DRAFT_302543 [Cucurbitaria berberidis CBS 394.84]|uniref:RBR-type E3 ubiquitin transferase n=1 Tax=Cucurbitaria berberidis CBS 394.84 TaxID=1168544 RepID=A0A9P4GSY5_9PLEO|nr:uncharacterized protein K460DRAFT_302543 [Cucurbitaria berberidis CBS 394.84]KAF1850949.1 hypothetical protein K460DRAFT_302543 [Cucurbitaria berberidis CBS 394.84]
MAPSTRLQSQPEMRVNYAPTTSRTGTRGNPILLEEAPPEAAARRPLGQIIQTARKSTTRVEAGGVAKPKAEPKKAVEVASKSKGREHARQECSICATTKTMARSFKVLKIEDACEHLQGICYACIQKMLKAKVVERQLTEAELACPFPDCDHVLDYMALKMTVTKAAFEQYDTALAKRLLSADEFYIACLSRKCGMYFSIEGCKSDKRGKQKIACPYCEYEICSKCNRPWKSHGTDGCNKAKEKEDRASEKMVKALGAKPCPQCGLNIQKNGGCDHMTCQHCRQHFCWQCLVLYSNNFQHAEGCIHGQVNVAADPRNWAADNLNGAQMNHLIHQAHARLTNMALNPPAPLPAPAWAPAAPPQPVPDAAPRLNMQLLRAQAPIQFHARIFNFLGFGGGNGGDL